MNTVIEKEQDIKQMLNDKNCIEVVQSLFEAIAYRDTIASIIEPEQQKILDEHEFYVSDEWVEKRLNAGRDVKKERITQHKNLYLAHKDDWQRYDELMLKAYDRVNIHPSKEGNCPLLEADSLVRDVKIAVANSLEPYMGMSYNDISYNLKAYKQYYELIMTMFVDKVKNNFK